MKWKIVLLIVVSLLAAAGAAWYGVRPNTGTDDPRLDMAYFLHRGVLGFTEETTARDMLRLNVLELSYEGLEEKRRAHLSRTRSAFRGARLNLQFLDEFERAIEWVDALLRQPPNMIYEESKRYEASPPWLEATAFVNTTVALHLLMLAADRDFKPASYDLGQIYIDGNEAWPGGHPFTLEILADDGYLSAQRDLADRYLTGRGLEPDLARAYYWARRARMNGEADANLFGDIERQISSMDRARAEVWLKEGEYPRNR